MDDVKKHNELSLIIDDRQWLPAAPAGSERQNKRASCSLRALACNVTALLTCLGSEGWGVRWGGTPALPVGFWASEPLRSLPAGFCHGETQTPLTFVRHLKWKSRWGRCRSSTSLTFSISPSRNRSNGNSTSVVDCESGSKTKLTSWPWELQTSLQALGDAHAAEETSSIFLFSFPFFQDFQRPHKCISISFSSSHVFLGFLISIKLHLFHGLEKILWRCVVLIVAGLRKSLHLLNNLLWFLNSAKIICCVADIVMDFRCYFILSSCLWVIILR